MQSLVNDAEYAVPLLSFPRRRESRLLTWTVGLDSRLRGNDRKRILFTKLHMENIVHYIKDAGFIAASSCTITYSNGFLPLLRY